MSDLPSPPNKRDADGHEAGARKGPRVILPDARVQTVVESIETAVPVMQQRRPFVGFAASLGLGLVGSAIWAGITLATNYQLGLVAIVIGVLAGIGARMGGPGREAQWTGAICAAICYFVGQTAIIAAYPGLWEQENVLINSFKYAVGETFSGMGIIFLAIAVYEGYRIPRAG
ncbi:MAG: hypothetical protein O7B26_13060 [Planctomycetota bacterium]|nr:hypothetical protein [Planctomycetota bacterium]